MLKPNLKPKEQFIKFTEPATMHGRLKIHIKIYDEPVMSTDHQDIFSTIEILEEDDSRFGFLACEAILKESEVKEAFRNIIADPMKFKLQK